MLKTWPRQYAYGFLVVLAAFWLWGTVRAVQMGNTFYDPTDGTSEAATIYAANHYVSHGFWEHSLLPTYPPHGVDEHGSQRTTDFVYTHYLPGLAWILGIVFKLFGTGSIWFARLIPHTLSVLALGFLAKEFAAYTRSPIQGCVLLGLFMIPRAFTMWTTCLYGHSYAAALYLLMAGYMLRLVNLPKTRQLERGVFFLVLGFLLMELEFDWMPLTFLSIAAFGALLYPRFTWKEIATYLVIYCAGAGLATLLQLVLVSFYHGSLSGALTDYATSFRTRSADGGPVKVNDPKSLYLNRLLHEFDKQSYGATGFSAVNMIELSLLAVWMAFWSRMRNLRDAKIASGGVVLAYLSAASWNILMRQHSQIHVFFIHRHYFVLYVVMLIVALPIGFELVRRAAKASKG